MNKWFLVGLLGLSLIGYAAVTQINADEVAAKKVEKARATFQSAKGGKVSGTVEFILVNGGVQIVADINGLSPGYHGFHIHEKGDCSAPDFSSAGGHFNPTDRKHGGPDSEERHVGDLGNLKADENGHAYYDRIDSIIKLDGKDSIVGRAIIVHEKADDYVTQPTGDAGGKLACGVIEAVED